MISWADSIITWSLSIIKLTQPSLSFSLFQNPFSSQAGQALGTRDLEWRLGTVCSGTPSATSPIKEPPAWKESGRRSVEKRAHISLLNWSWLLCSPCWCMCFGDRHEWAGIFIWMAQVQMLLSVSTCGFLGGPCRDTHCTVPLYLFQHFHNPSHTRSCHWWSPHRPLWLESSHWVEVLLAGMPASWLPHR